MLTRARDDFLTEEQRMIRDTARDFARAELAPHAGAWEDQGWIPDAVVAKMGELGLLGMTVPPEWGGTGADYLSYILAVEEVAAGCAATAVLMSVHNGLGCGLVLAWGSESQKRAWMPKLVTGEAIACFCLTEPQAGSEANNLKTRATQAGDGWVLEGTKQFISNAKRARLAVVFAVTDPAAGKKGLSAFLVATDTPGFQVQKPEKKLGLKALDTCPIVLADCRVPGEALLGPRGKGLAIALSNLEGGQWRLDGTKQFISNAKRAKLAIVFAVTDPDQGKRGLSAFLVPTDAVGFHVQKPESKMGLRALDTCAILLERCAVDEGALLGPRGKGLAIALSNLEGGRIGIAAQALGIARAAFEAALAYAKERNTFGKPIVEHQSIANMLADMHTRLNAARLLVLQAARMRDAGLPCLSEASQAKLYASELAEWVCSKAIQVHGGYGYIEDFPVERHYRDARVTQIYEGTSEVQRMLIARSLAQ